MEMKNLGDVKMATRTRTIIEIEGHQSLIKTVRCNDGTDLYPGMVVTAEGHTAPDVGRMDSSTEKPLGIIANLTEQDVDTNNADNDEVSCYLIGGAHTGFVKVVAACKVTLGERLYGDNLDSGHVIPHHKAFYSAGLASASVVSRVMGQFVGMALEDKASNASVDLVLARW